MDQHDEQQHDLNGQLGHDHRPGAKVNLDAIPEELRELDRWLCWQHATEAPASPIEPVLLHAEV